MNLSPWTLIHAALLQQKQQPHDETDIPHWGSVSIISAAFFLFNFPVFLLLPDGSANCSAEGSYGKDHALTLSVDPACVCSAVHQVHPGDH